MNHINQLIESLKFCNYKPACESHETKKETSRILRQTSLKKRLKEKRSNLHLKQRGAILNKGGHNEKVLHYSVVQANIAPISSSSKADNFTKAKVLKRLHELPSNVIITDFDQTITDVKSSRDYYEEFKAVRGKKDRILLWKDIIRLIILRIWSKKFPSQRNKLAFYKFLLPGLSVDRIADRHEINPNFIKAARIIQHYKPDAVFGICSVGIGQVVEKTIAKIGLNGYALMLNIYEEEKGILTGNVINDYLFTESDKQDFPRNHIILGDDSDQKWLNSWPLFLNINSLGFEEKIREVLTQTKSKKQKPFQVVFKRRGPEIIATT